MQYIYNLFMFPAPNIEQVVRTSQNAQSNNLYLVGPHLKHSNINKLYIYCISFILKQFHYKLFSNVNFCRTLTYDFTCKIA